MYVCVYSETSDKGHSKKGQTSLQRTVKNCALLTKEPPKENSPSTKNEQSEFITRFFPK